MLGSKVALITGAAQGIGLATAKLLLRNGAKVSLYTLAEANVTEFVDTTPMHVSTLFLTIVGQHGGYQREAGQSSLH